MSDTKTPTAADLLAEWKQLKKVGKRNPHYWSNIHDAKIVAAQLDEMCKDSSISYVDEVVLIHNTLYNAKQLHAILEWLLIKGK